MYCCITYVMNWKLQSRLHLVERWADRNQSIEISLTSTHQWLLSFLHKITCLSFWIKKGTQRLICSHPAFFVDVFDYKLFHFVSDSYHFHLQESVLADHFSSFGELSSVVLEDTEAHNHDAALKPSLSCSACVTYTTRQSAEKAFIGGKSCKGHTLRFMWLTASPGSNNHSGPQNFSVPVRASSISGHTQSISSESPSPVGKVSSLATSVTVAIPHNKSISTVEYAKTSPVGIAKASCSSFSLSSNDESPPECGSTGNVISDSDVPQWGTLHWIWK